MGMIPSFPYYSHTLCIWHPRRARTHINTLATRGATMKAQHTQCATTHQTLTAKPVFMSESTVPPFSCRAAPKKKVSASKGFKSSEGEVSAPEKGFKCSEKEVITSEKGVKSSEGYVERRHRNSTKNFPNFRTGPPSRPWTRSSASVLPTKTSANRRAAAAAAKTVYADRIWYVDNPCRGGDRERCKHWDALRCRTGRRDSVWVTVLCLWQCVCLCVRMDSMPHRKIQGRYMTTGHRHYLTDICCDILFQLLRPVA